MENDIEMVKISTKTLQRLPKYLNYLKKCSNRGVEFISASQISRDLRIQHTQVRKDIAITGAQGIPKVGHEVEVLITSIKKFLGWDNLNNAFLIGMGNLGRAICGYEGFKNVGIDTVAAFDIDPEIIGKRISNTIVLDIDKFIDLANRMHVQIAILTVPVAIAQEMADMCVASGIHAIWNFCPISLKVPESVIVENMDIYSSLGILSRKLKEKSDRELQEVSYV